MSLTMIRPAQRAQRAGASAASEASQRSSSRGPGQVSLGLRVQGLGFHELLGHAS